MKTLDEKEQQAMGGLKMFLWEEGDMAAAVRELGFLDQEGFKFLVMGNLLTLETTVQPAVGCWLLPRRSPTAAGGFGTYVWILIRITTSSKVAAVAIF